jgi:DNA invertase Pin-like site-specific DNA recombinase
MMNETGNKITSEHLSRKAYLYVRQSSVKQIFEHGESTRRQYALRDRAVLLGWRNEDVVVIDTDLGQSGAHAEGREGFKQLVSEVVVGNAGIVIGLEVSRLARNSSDWHRLLEICALSNTLILDEEGIYDPGNFNDRLLLGLKGTMSEAELHFIKARMLGGALSKAKRGELHTMLPIGFEYGSEGEVQLEPDRQIRQSISLVFEIFKKVGTAFGTVRYFRDKGIKFPRKIHKGVQKGEVVWGRLVHSRVIQILHNPRYAGAYFFGKIRRRRLADGRTSHKELPREKWHSFIQDAHEGYISWEEYEENQRRLKENAQAYGIDRRNGPAREGPALLQGLVICSACGRRMSVYYYLRRGNRIPYYSCQRENKEKAEAVCQRINGEKIDEAMGKLLVESMSPLALEVALQVQDEIRIRVEEMDRLRKQQVERARYEADLARRRYMQVDPENRMVADTLEADWNDKLRLLKEAREEYERQCQKDRKVIDDKAREGIMALATDFPRLWNDASTACREKKRMIRLLIEDVTLKKLEDGIASMSIRFKGGAIKLLNVQLPLKAWEQYKTSKELVSQVDNLIDLHTDAEIAEILNNERKVTGMGKHFSRISVATIRKRHGLKSRYDRLKERNFLTLKEVSEKILICEETVRDWAKNNIIRSCRYNDRNGCLYELDGKNIIEALKKKQHHAKKGREFIRKLYERISEV